MFWGEMKKLFGKRILQLLFLFALAANGVLGYISETANVDAVRADAAAYTALQRDIAALSDEEKAAYIEAGLADAELMQEIYTNEMFGADDEDYLKELYPDLDYDEAVKRYYAGDYLKYTDNFFSEKALYTEVGQELELCMSYSAYVQSTLDKTLSALKKIDDHDSYQFQNMAGIYLAFDGVKDVQTCYGPVRGIRMALENGTTDLWAILFLVMCCVMIISVEREKNLLLLAKSTRNGRGRLGVYKLLVLYISCLLAMLLHVENLLLGAGMYGLGDLSRSIQSVMGYQGCTLRVSVGLFIALVYAGRLLFYLMCVSVFYLICAVFSRSVWVYAVTAGLAAGCALLYFGISNTSWLVSLKLLLPFGILRMNEVLGVYRNLRIGTMAVSRINASFMVLLVLMLICAAASVLIFAGTKEKESKKAVPCWKISGKLRGISECHTGSMRHEAYKVFFSQHALIILLLAGGVIFLSFQPQTVPGDTEEIYYRDFVTAVCGPAEDVKDDYWKNMLERLDQAYAAAAAEENFQSISSLSAAQRALERVVSHAQYLGEKEGSWYLYDAAYLIITGGDSAAETTEQKNALFLIVLCVFCYTGMYAMDYQNDGIALLKSTRYGRGRLTKNKLLIGIGIGIVVYGMTWLPQLLYTFRTCQTAELLAPAYSMEHLSWLPKAVSIGGYLLLLGAVRLMGVFALMLLTCSVTTYFRSFIVSGCVALGISALPIALVLLGVHFMRYVLLTPVILGTVCFSGPAALAAGMVQCVAVICISMIRLKSA